MKIKYSSSNEVSIKISDLNSHVSFENWLNKNFKEELSGIKLEKKDIINALEYMAKEETSKILDTDKRRMFINQINELSKKIKD